MKFYLYSHTHRSWIQVSHKQARRRGFGRVIPFPKYGRFYFDSIRGGNWTPKKVMDFDPRPLIKDRDYSHIGYSSLGRISILDIVPHVISRNFEIPEDLPDGADIYKYGK